MELGAGEGNAYKTSQKEKDKYWIVSLILCKIEKQQKGWNKTKPVINSTNLTVELWLLKKEEEGG